MVTEFLLDALFSIADFFLGLLPEIEWSFNNSIWGAVVDVLSMVCYLLPMQHIIGVILGILAIAGARFAIARLLFLIRFVPFL